MITLRNIKKLYRADNIETAALSNVNLQIDQGEFVAIMGPSGCGKSTLLNILGMIDTPSDGRIPLLRRGRRARMRRASSSSFAERQLGFVFQSFNLIDDLTVYENVELPLLYQNVPRSERKSRVREVLERVDLRTREKHKPAAALGRPAAARGGRARRGVEPEAHPRRRAHRQPRHEER